VQVIEAYAERLFAPRHGFVDVRAGRYRLPFGISAASDHSYTGFVRAPLIRYDGYWALSNNFLEHGLDVAAGAAWLTLEASVGTPADIGTAVRRSGTDVALRAQSAIGPLIAGVSHVDTSPYMPATFAKSPNEFSGVDVRWMIDGVQLRGEWITGQPFSGTSTTGVQRHEHDRLVRRCDRSPSGHGAGDRGRSCGTARLHRAPPGL
jgi:hypothetical protein